MIGKIKAAFAWVWGHRTKTLGLIAGAVAYGEKHLADLGHVLPIKWTGSILGGFAVITFLIGLYNSLVPAGQDEPSSIPSTKTTTG
jgi:hypothetical protein